MKIAFLIRSLNYGGAERQLVTLAKGLRDRGHEVVVLVFYAGGPLEGDLHDLGIRVCPLEKRGRWEIWRFLVRLYRRLRPERPDIVHGYLSEPNLVLVALKPFLRGMKVIWGIRTSYMDLRHYDWLSTVSFKISCLLSRFADLIIANSHAGSAYHVSNGFPDRKMVVVPNGIDTNRFRPDRDARLRVRAEWRIDADETLVGLVGRLDPMKDHGTFLRAASLLSRERQDVRFVCVGDGPEHYRRSLVALAEQLGVSERVLWVPARRDGHAVFNALDLAVSSSYGEGFPNVIAEAMACGVPCVVTDVGDSAWIVGETGHVVPPRDPSALKAAIATLLDGPLPNPALVRNRVVECLSALELARKTERAFLQLKQGMPAL